MCKTIYHWIVYDNTYLSLLLLNEYLLHINGDELYYTSFLKNKEQTFFLLLK
ncbi:hypothetical protein OXB_2890 [Bacillus sp. OxB-1]|nr:hypothetical protein OXB_2890 [Bacillus sp. OxB-1]